TRALPPQIGARAASAARSAGLQRQQACGRAGFREWSSRGQQQVGQAFVLQEKGSGRRALRNEGERPVGEGTPRPFGPPPPGARRAQAGRDRRETPSARWKALDV